MSDAVLSVTFSGPHVSVQDGGRFGMLRYGAPRSGAMDRLAFAAANVALGQDAGASGIEISIGGLQLKCESGSVTFAVAGGGFIVEHNGQKRQGWCVATLRAGEKLIIRRGHWGSWCYLAFAGELQAKSWAGSTATHATSGMGGGLVKTGAKLTIANAAERPALEGDLPLPVRARPRASVRVTMGPQVRFFTDETLKSFATGDWQMTDQWDRMGVRLAGPLIAPSAKLDMPSEPIVRGSIQVAGDGVATVLLADHQSTGGYPKIATVIDSDLDGFVQLRPRDPVQFSAVTPAEAVQIARTSALSRQSYLEALARRVAQAS